MTLDSSALVAILFEEPGYLTSWIGSSSRPARVGAPTLVETSVVAGRRRSDRPGVET